MLMIGIFEYLTDFTMKLEQIARRIILPHQNQYFFVKLYCLYIKTTDFVCAAVALAQISRML